MSHYDPSDPAFDAPLKTAADMPKPVRISDCCNCPFRTMQPGSDPFYYCWVDAFQNKNTILTRSGKKRPRKVKYGFGRPTWCPLPVTINPVVPHDDEYETY